MAWRNTASSTTSCNDDQWKHVVVVFDTTQSASNEISIYINGTKEVVTKDVNQDNSSIFTNRIIRFAGAVNLFLSDVKIFTHTLTQAEIIQLYNE